MFNCLMRNAVLRCRPTLAVRRQQRCLATASQFEAAKKKLDSLKADPGNEVKLQLYALYKQATVGACNIDKPSALNFVAKAKYDAWSALGKLSSDDARSKYVKLIEKLTAAEAAAGGASPKVGETTVGAILKRRVGKALKITLNRPDKRNAISMQMYQELSSALQQAAADDDVAVVALTGSGPFYSSGNDLKNFQQFLADGTVAEGARRGRRILHDFVGAFIEFPKPLVAFVNGPAVGIAVTTLGLCDVVWCNDQATFHTPFAQLGQTPEGGSSFTFVRQLGQSVAMEMMLFGRKLSAQEALSCGLVSRVVAAASFERETDAALAQWAGLPARSLLYGKQLVRQTMLQLLRDANDAECARLEERWQSEDCANAIMAFLSRKAAPN